VTVVAAVAPGVVQGVGGRAPVAHRQKLFAVVVGFGPVGVQTRHCETHRYSLT
jgi:hypothetical protein